MSDDTPKMACMYRVKDGELETRTFDMNLQGAAAHVSRWGGYDSPKAAKEAGAKPKKAKPKASEA